MYSKALLNSVSNIKIQLKRSLASQILENKIKLSSNITLNFAQSGQGEHSVLCMPGALGSAWTDFKPQLELLPALLENHTIIAWDPPGYGKSQPPVKKFSIDFLNKDAEYAYQLMNELGRTNFSILGWSDGGITGMILAGTHTNSVKKLIIWGANAYITKEETEILKNIRDVKKWSLRMREPMENIYGAVEFQNLWSNWVDVMLSIYYEKNGNFCKKEVEKISCPTLILHGKLDPMISSEHVPYLRQKIAACKYHEFPNGKHNIHLRYADEFNKIISEFIKNYTNIFFF